MESLCIICLNFLSSTENEFLQEILPYDSTSSAVPLTGGERQLRLSKVRSLIFHHVNICFMIIVYHFGLMYVVLNIYLANNVSDCKYLSCVSR